MINVPQSEWARLEEHARFAAIVQSSDDAIIGKTLEGIVTSWNQGAERIYGYTEQEMVGRSVSLLAPPNREDEVPRLLARLVQGESVEHFETVRRRKDGQIIFVSLTLSPIRSTAGAIVGASAIARDITARKRAEEALAHRTRQLEVLARACRQVNMVLEVPAVLRALVASAMELTNATAGAAGLMSEGRMVFTEYHNRGDWLPINYAFETGYGVPGRIIATKAPYVSNDAVHDAHVIPEIQKALGFYNLVDVPILTRTGELVGCFEIHNTADHRPFDQHDVELLLGLAASAAIALENAGMLEERNRAEEQQRRLNRELRAVSECNQTLLRATDEQALLNDICRIVCAEAGYRMAWVGMAEQDDAKRVRPVAWAGIEDGYLATVGITWADSERGRGPSGTAVRTGKTTYFQDFASDPHAGPWREAALQRGYRSNVALPLKDESARVFGVLTIYAAEPNAFTLEEIRLVEELAGDLAYGITTLRARAERKRSEKQVALLSFALNSVREGAFLIDEVGRFQFVNDESCRLLGYTRGELLTMRVADVDPDFPAELWPAHWEELRTRHSLCFEGRHRAKDGRIFPVEINANFLEFGGKAYNLGLVRDITERKGAEQARLAHLRFMETMDRVSQAMKGTDDLEKMMNDVLEVVLSTFECDRTFLMYPCDPAAAVWTSPMERTRPEYPGVFAMRLEMPMDPEVAETLRTLLAADGPVKFGPGTPHPLPADVSERFGFKCFMSMALYPTVGKPWQFGVHQCSYARVWTEGEERLFQEIGRRLTDGLSTFLAHRNLQDSKEKLEEAQRIAHIGYWDRDIAHQTVTLAGEAGRIFGIATQETVLPLEQWHEHWLALIHPEDQPRLIQAVRDALSGASRYDLEYRIVRPDGEVRHVHSEANVTRDEAGRPHRMLGMMQDITNRKRIEDLLRFIAQLGWAAKPEDFLASLASHLGGVLNADYVLIDKLAEEPGMAKTVALYAKGRVEPNLTYALKGTPCENIIGKRLCCYPRGVQALFPEDRLLVEMEVESYIGIPLWDSSAACLGLIAVMDRGPISDEATVAQLLQVAAIGAATFLERLRSDLLLRQSEADLELALEAGRLGDWKWDIVTGAVAWSPRCKSLYGLGADAPVDYERFLGMVHPDDRERVAAALARAVETRADYEVEKRVLWPDGSVHWTASRGRVYSDATGRPIHMTGVTVDITQRKHAEVTREALLSLEASLNRAGTPIEAARTIFATADRLWRWDSGTLDLYSPEEDRAYPVLCVDLVEGQRREVPSVLESEEPSPRMRRILQNGPELITRTPPIQVPDDAKMVGDTARPSACLMCVPLHWEEQAIGVLSVQSYTPGAFTRDDLRTLQSLADHCGAALRRIRSTEELRKSEGRYRELTFLQGEGLGIVDAQERFTFVNPAGEAIFGVLPGGLIGQSLREFVTDTEFGRILAQTQRRRAGEKSTYEVEIRRSDNQIRHLLVSAVPQLDAAGQFTGTLALFMDITDRKRAEASLQESESKFRSLAETSPVGILIHQGGLLRYINPVFEAVTGYTRDQLLRMNFWEIVHPDFRDLVRARGLGRCRGEQPPAQYEFKILTQSGEERWVELRASPLEFEGLPAVLATLFDVTDRKQAEAALRESEERYRKLIAASPDAITVTDLEGIIRLSSPKALELFRVLSEEQAMGHSIFEWVSESDRSRAVENMQRLLATGAAPYRDFVLRRNDGTTFDAEVSSALIHAADGTARGAIIITRDVTERKQAAEALRKLSRAVEQSPDSIMITDKAGNIEYVNPKFTRVTGYSQDEVLGKNPRLLKSGTTPDQEYRRLWQTISSGKEWQGEFHNRKKNGELYWENASISPIFDASGAITHFLAMKEDITQRKRLEEEFHQAQKLEAVGQLAGGVAHDFNNILAAILMNLGLLQGDSNLTDAMKAELKELEREAQRAAGLTRQLLLFSRRQALEAKPLELNEIIDNMTKMLRRLIGEDIDLVLQGQTERLWVLADAGMLEQVLMNLCVNARDAMPDGGQLIIGTQRAEIDEASAGHTPGARAGSFICLTVEDTGCGMDAATLEHIFEPFFTTKGIGKGTGLGLATVYGIVNQHHGWIHVDSALGKGSAFQVYLPALQEVGESHTASARGEIRGGTETILLVEDDSSLRRVAALGLRKLGYAVLEAADGVEAVKLWEQHRAQTNLILTDMVMPGGMTGLEVAERLMAEKKEVKVIITTGYNTEKLSPETLVARGIAYLSKPYDLAVLARIVRTCLDQTLNHG